MLTTKKKHMQAIDTQAPPGLRYLRLGGVKFFDSLTEIFKSPATQNGANYFCPSTVCV